MEEQLNLSLTRFPKDAYIILAGETRIADRFYFIREGKVRLRNEMQITEKNREETLGPGDFFGVAAAMSGHSHIETALAITDVLLVAVTPDQFDTLIKNNTPVAKKILLQFSRRMRLLNDYLTVLTLKKDASTDISHLFHVGEYYAKQYQYKQACYAYHQYIKHCPEGKFERQAVERLKRYTPLAKSFRMVVETGEMTRTYQKDDMIFAESEPGEEVFVIRSGSVKIAKISKNSEILLAILNAGDIFGEMALLESKPRDASAVAFEKCELMVMNRANFDHMIRTQTQLITKLTVLLAGRIWMSYKQLANTRINDSLGRMYDMLMIQLEKKRSNLNSRGSCTFDFGSNELINMIGLSINDGSSALYKLLQGKLVEIVKNKVVVKSIWDFSRQASFYQKKLRIEKNHCP